MLEEHFFLTHPMIYFGSSVQSSDDTEILFSVDTSLLNRTHVGVFMILHDVNPN
ncbi:MAG TPA: hypothetical protein VJK48_06945 [Chlamydiales bacterium]|nr:hypothetical protein [Chlamydiales bacterium]